MITWFFGQTGAGKTTAACALVEKTGGVLLDGNAMRRTISTELDFSLADRLRHHERVARLAALLDAQGFSVVVATIMPTKNIREVVRNLLKGRNVEYVYVPGGFEPDQDRPFEAPDVLEYHRMVTQ